MKRTDLSNIRSRFEAKVNRNGPVPAHCPELGPCAEWTGATTDSGYGLFHHEGVRAYPVRAHRLAWFFEHGRWPAPCGLHRCDNRRCVRIDHLFEGTKRDNAKDMVAKGRHARRPQIGEKNGHVKLTESDVRVIREIYSTGQMDQIRLASRFNVSQRNISMIVRRVTWSHLP